MKRKHLSILAISLLFLLGCGKDGEVWEFTENPLFGEVLSAVAPQSTALFVVNENVAYNVTNDRLDVTRDGGQSWGVAWSASADDVYDAYFETELHGFFTADDKVYMTDDGGTTSIIKISSGEHLQCIDGQGSFIVAAGYNGMIVYSNDGGQNWSTDNASFFEDINGVVVRDEQTAFVVAQYGNILRTSNGGQTWQSVQNPLMSASSNFFDISFGDANVGFIAGGQQFMKTTDGGLSWVQFLINDNSSHYITNVAFKDALNGIMLERANIYLRTYDGGVSWESHRISEENGQQDIFRNGNYLYLMCQPYYTRFE
jgi:photosystem II stability/assembly factor-like uncharacterized protein